MKATIQPNTSHHEGAGRYSKPAAFAHSLRLLALAALLLPLSTRADTIWMAGTGNWFTGANWDTGVPTSVVNAQINNSGTAQIGASGAVTQRLYLGYNSGNSGTVQVTAGGTLTSINSVNVGYSGTGTLTIEGGGSIANTFGQIGYNSGATGTATVMGAGSQWTNSNVLYVGYSGTGTLNVSDGGTVTNVNDGFIGSQAGSSGMATVTGAGSSWKINFGSLNVGYSGNGTLNIENGGTVTNSNGFLGEGTGSSGTVMVTGAGSKWTNNGALYMGYWGTATLNIENGGTVTNIGSSNLGYIAGLGTATVTVTGVGSKWTNSGALYLGYSGTGTLNIADGGTVTNTTGYMGYNSGSSGTATVTGIGSKWTNSGALYLGYSGTGTLNIENGGTVTNTTGYLGLFGGSSGTITVTGIGSKWTNSSNLYVGSYGTGTLNIENGGMVTNISSYLGNNTGSSGIVTVKGTGSKWTNSSILYVGYSGAGTLNIENGGAVTNTVGYMGYTGGTGMATVTGAGSKWTNSSGLYMGVAGTATLNVENSGTVTNTTGYMGYNSGSSGTATVTGIGSKWTNSGALYVGYSGTGTLNIANSGVVNVNAGGGTLSLGLNAGSNGTLNIGNGSSAGVLNAALVNGGSGAAVVNFNHTDADYFFANDGTSTGAAVLITGTASVNHIGSGATTLSGVNTYTGATYVNAGTLNVRGSIANTFLHLAGGNFSPGSVGTVQTVTVNSLSLQGGGLLMDLAAGGVSDHITVIDDLASLTAPALFTFNDLGADGTTYHLIDGLDIANPWDLTLLSFTGVDGSFLLSVDLTELLFTLSMGNSTSGAVIQNSVPVGTSANANFLVNGPVQTGGPTENNTIRSLTFNPGSSLQVFNNLTVTGGNFTVNSGRASINGGRVIVPGDFNKNGRGTLVANTYLQVGGNANINEGALLVNGTLEADRVNVFHGALLGGSGVIFGSVFNSGIVAPGNSPGTLTIIGNYTQTSIGTLQIEIASKNVFDRLVVSGTARLDGTLDIRNYHGNTLVYGQQVPFLQAGKIVGTFDEILMPEDNLFRGRFLNAGHTGILLVAPASYTLVAKTPNQTRMAKALDSWIGTEDGDIEEVTLALDLLALAQYPVAFEAIMPGYYEAALNTGIELSQNQGQLLNQQLSSRRLGQRSAPAEMDDNARPLGQRSGGKNAKNVVSAQPQLAMEEDPHWNGWMQGSGLFSEGGLSLNPGEDFESGTFMVGADYALSEHFAVGLFASYQEGWGDYNNGGNIDLETVRFGGYATVDFGGFYANAAVGGGTTDYSVKRPIQWATLDRTARSSPDGAEFFTMLGTGYDFHAGNFTFGPSLSAQYTKLKLNGFTEQGASSLDLRVSDAEEESLRTYLGGRVAYTLKVNDKVTLIPELRAFWQHEFLQGGENLHASLNGGNGPRFNYLTDEPGKDAMYAGAGVGILLGENLTLSVYYHVNLGRNDDAQHTVSVSANLKF